MNNYNTNTIKLTCSCTDWKEKRKNYSIENPKRLCKHLVNKLNINNLPYQLEYFKEDIEYFKSKEKGFYREFEVIKNIPSTDYIMLVSKSGFYFEDWINIYSPQGQTYGLIINGSNSFIWAKSNKPKEYEKIEAYFSSQISNSHLPLQGNERSKLITYIKSVMPNKTTNYISIEDNFSIPDKNGVYYDFEYDSCYEGKITVRNDLIIIETNDKKKFVKERDYKYAKEWFDKIQKQINIRQKQEEEKWKKIYEEKKQQAETKGYLYNIKGSSYYELTKDKDNRESEIIYEKYLKLMDKISKNFIPTKELLNEYKINLTTLNFNKALKKLNYIVKKKELNNNEWILIDDGLKFGINLSKDSSLFSAKIPEWYEITELDIKNKRLIKLTDKTNVRMTKILWEKTKVQELFKIVISLVEKENVINKNLEEEKKLSKEKKQEIRDTWLNDLFCPKCQSQNIHKKDKRERKNFTVQRYQCMDCKHIFQKKIEEASKEEIISENTYEGNSFFDKIKNLFK